MGTSSVRNHFPRHTYSDDRIGALIREGRFKKRWTQKQLGKKLAQAEGRIVPYSQATVSGYERGKNPFLPHQLSLLGELLDIPSEAFTNDSIVPCPSSQTKVRVKPIRWGTNDQVLLRDDLGVLHLTFTSQHYTQLALLVNLPIGLSGAVQTALVRSSGTFEYFDKEFEGRIIRGMSRNYPVAWVVAFPRGDGFLILMGLDELSTLRDRLSVLPFRISSTT